MNDQEMDKLIAERVMGWRKSEISPMWLDRAGKSTVAQFSWHPTTDDGQAVRALEVMRAKGYDIRLGSVAKSNEWWAWLSPYDEGVSFYDALLSRAICLAICESGMVRG